MISPPTPLSGAREEEDDGADEGIRCQFKEGFLRSDGQKYRARCTPREPASLTMTESSRRAVNEVDHARHQNPPLPASRTTTGSRCCTFGRVRNLEALHQLRGKWARFSSRFTSRPFTHKEKSPCPRVRSLLPELLEGYSRGTQTHPATAHHGLSPGQLCKATAQANKRQAKVDAKHQIIC